MNHFCIGYREVKSTLIVHTQGYRLILFQVQLRQKYYAPQVWPDWGLKPWPQGHGQYFSCPLGTHHWATRDLADKKMSVAVQLIFYGPYSSSVCNRSQYVTAVISLTLKVLNFWKLTSYCRLNPYGRAWGKQCRFVTSPTLHPPSPPTVHQLSWLALLRVNWLHVFFIYSLSAGW